MKVNGPGAAGAAGASRGARPQSAAGGFSPITTQATSETSITSHVSGVNSLEALIALQEVGGPLERRRKAVSRAGLILDTLEELKVDMLDGTIAPQSAQKLVRLAREQRSLTDDPRLESLLDEIETRAAVELAKLEMGRVAA